VCITRQHFPGPGEKVQDVMADKSATIEGGMPVAPPEPEKDIELEEKTRPVRSNSDSADSDNKNSSDAKTKSKSKKSHTPWYNPLRWNPPPPPKERAVSREFKANVFSQFIFWWANDLLYVGYKRPLELQDLPRLAPERHNKPISERLDKEFRRRVAKGDKHPLLFALNTTFFNEFWFGGACQLLAIVLMTLSPLILKYIIQYSSDAYYGDHSNSGRGIGLAVGVIAMQLTGALAINQWAYRSLIVGGMARGSLISLIYAKSQVISARAKAGGSGMKKSEEEVEVDEKGKKTKKGEEAKSGDEEEGWSNGRVSNLMSTDTSRINQAVEWSQLMVTTPIQIIIALIQLVINLGPAALPGFGLLMICGPGMYFITRSLAKRRGKTNKITDARISLTQELLSSIRFVKYFAWEKYFLDKLEVLRKKEIYQVQVLLGARSAITAVAMTLPVWAAILSFLTYSLTHADFNPANIFASLALFNTLRIPLNLLPMVIGQSIDAYVSLGRIEQYLQAEDDTSKRAVNDKLPEAILFEDASFTWETVGGSSESDVEKSDDKSAQGVNDARAADAKAAIDSQAPFQLENLNLSISRDELIAVVGAVGCGKTSLLAAIAGEMRQITGEVQQGSNIAYCSQYAWIQNATVKDNITFGQPFVKEWYDKVVDACALKPDFKMFTAGDLTEVGERGITLSGGQKQRISIARAIYFNASIIVSRCRI
jgi:ATP-binding cassette subfamily C (CFTR/MRP) protein 1